MKKVLVLGATSAIAQATCRLLASRGAKLYLVARNAENLAAVQKDLTVRGAQVEVETADLNLTDQHEALVKRADEKLGGMDWVLLAHGILGDQAESEKSFAAAEKVLLTNFTGAVSLLTHAANLLEARRAGTIVAISSVAGDRGRQSNYVYGASKGGLNVFLQGLRNRLARSNVAVVNVKPGFVDTPMTAHIKKNGLFASPDKVAKGIVRAADKRKNDVYVPGFWGLIMLIVRSVPEPIFKKLKL